MKQLNIAIFILMFFFASCASPKHDGENQAHEECEMWDEYVQKNIKAYTNFVNEFGSKNYQTRTEARKELDRRIDEVETQLASQLEKLDAKYSALLEKYGDDQDKLEEMCNSYNRIIDAYNMDTTQFSGLRVQAQDKILTIIPPNPTVEKIKKNMVGRVIKDIPEGYFSEYWSWTIKDGEIKNLQILEVEEVDKNHRELLVEMTLQSDGAAYKTICKIYYILDNRDDWEIDMLEPSEVDIVKTGRYNSSIKTTFRRYGSEVHMDIHNNGDAALLVGFRRLDIYGHYSKYSLIVGGGETRKYWEPLTADFTIDFVERP